MSKTKLLHCPLKYYIIINMRNEISLKCIFNYKSEREKKDFAEVFKSLTKYKCKNNLLDYENKLYKTLEHDEQCCKKF